MGEKIVTAYQLRRQAALLDDKGPSFSMAEQKQTAKMLREAADEMDRLDRRAVPSQEVGSVEAGELCVWAQQKADDAKRRAKQLREYAAWCESEESASAPVYARYARDVELDEDEARQLDIDADIFARILSALRSRVAETQAPGTAGEPDEVQCPRCHTTLEVYVDSGTGVFLVRAALSASSPSSNEAINGAE